MDSRVPSRTLCSLLETVPACPLPQKDWATLLHTCHRHRYLLVTKHFATKHFVTTISVPAEITLLKSACHFLLLLVGIDILTYRKDYNCTPCACGSSFPLWFGMGAVVLHKERRPWSTDDGDGIGSFYPGSGRCES